MSRRKIEVVKNRPRCIQTFNEKKRTCGISITTKRPLIHLYRYTFMMQSPHVQVWSFYHIFCFLSIWRAGWGVKRESNFKKYINDLHTSWFFFTYPLVRPKTTPCLSASPPLSPFSSSYLLTTEIVLCHGWLIIVFVKFTCTKSWLSIFCSLNLI